MGARWGCRRSWRYDRDISNDVKMFIYMKLKTKKEIRRYSHPQRTQNISKERKFLHCLRNQKFQAMELNNWIIKLYQIICAFPVVEFNTSLEEGSKSSLTNLNSYIILVTTQRLITELNCFYWLNVRRTHFQLSYSDQNNHGPWLLVEGHRLISPTKQTYTQK